MLVGEAACVQAGVGLLELARGGRDHITKVPALRPPTSTAPAGRVPLSRRWTSSWPTVPSTNPDLLVEQHAPGSVLLLS